jgi:hypothetical protein
VSIDPDNRLLGRDLLLLSIHRPYRSVVTKPVKQLLYSITINLTVRTDVTTALIIITIVAFDVGLAKARRQPIRYTSIIIKIRILFPSRYSIDS